MADPTDADLMASFQASQGQPAPTPQAPPQAPTMPYDQQYGVTRNLDGSIYGLPSGVSVQLAGPNASPEQQQPVTTPDTSPDRIAQFLAKHPEDIAHSIKPPTTAEPTDADLTASLQQQAPDAIGPAQPPAAAQQGAFSSPQAFLKAEGNGWRDVLNGATFGGVDRINATLAALPKLPQGTQAVGNAFSQEMDHQRALDADHPGIAHTVNSLAGGMAPALVMPEVQAPNILARAAVGAGQGALLSGLEHIGNARGNLPEMMSNGLPTMAAGAAIGAPLGAAFGASTQAAKLPQLASMEDYARAKVDPMLAVNGPQSAQRVGQMLKGLPLLGTPINEAAARAVGQTRAAVDRVAGRYGQALDRSEGGQPIIAANDRAAAAYQASRQSVADQAHELVQQFGGASGRRVAGENAQGAINRFANSRGVPATSGPARASSFASKSDTLYGDAFGRISREMEGKTEPPRVVTQRGIYHTRAGRTVQEGGSQITTPRSSAVLGEIVGRPQSAAIGQIVRDPTMARVAGALAASNAAKDISFGDLRALRTWVRLAQKNTELRQSIGSANLQRLEGGLTEDILGNADRLASPGAAAQLRRADQFYRTGNDRIRNTLERFFDAKSGEAAFDRVVGAASGRGADIASLRALQRSVSPEEWRDVAASTIAHMGESAEGFSLLRFVSSFDKLTPEGRQVLFGGRNRVLGTALDDLAQRGREVLASKPVEHFGATPNAAFEGLMSAAMARGRSANVPAIQTLRSALSEQEWGDVVSGVIRTMGQEGDQVNLAKFATQWDKLSPAGREALFGGGGRETDVGDLNAVVRIAKQMKAADKFYNHSNSGHLTAGVLVADKLGEMIAEGPQHIMHTAVHELPAVAALYGLGLGASKLLASPGFARLVLRANRAGGAEARSQVERALQAYANDNQPIRSEVLAYQQELARRFNANAPVAAGVAVQSRMREAADGR